MKIIADVKGLGKIVESYNDFYNELKELNANKARLISPREEAYARLQTQGRENIGKTNGTWTTAGFEYIKGKSPILRIKSRLNNQRLAELAVQANRSGNYYHTEDTRYYEESLKQAEKDKSKDPIERNVIILPSRDNFTISDKENWEVYQAVLKDQAKPYFESKGPIDVYPVDKSTVDAQDGTLLTQLWFGNLDSRSVLFGNSGDLLNVGIARGVSSVREAQKKISESSIKEYTTKDIKEAKKDLERLSRILQPNQFANLENLLNKLKQ